MEIEAGSMVLPSPFQFGMFAITLSIVLSILAMNGSPTKSNRRIIEYPEAFVFVRGDDKEGVHRFHRPAGLHKNQSSKNSDGDDDCRECAHSYSSTRVAPVAQPDRATDF